MTVAQLMFKLAALPPDVPVTVLDESNGCGHPREINLGPVIRTVTAKDSESVADLEGMEGKTVVVLGWGCY